MRILVIPDIHLKTWIIEAAEQVIMAEHPDKVVFLGDLVDDFGCKNNKTAYIQTVDAVVAFFQKHSEAYLCLGNHEASYLWNKETNATAYHARTVAKEQCYRLARERILQERFRIAFLFDDVIFSHAGISSAFVHAYAGDPDTLSAERIVRKINQLGVDELWQYSSPIWYRPTFIAGWDELYGENKILQVTGHTPMETIKQENNLVCCDTFSTYPNHKPIGDQTFCLVDTETQTWKAVPTCGMDLAMRNVKRGKASEPIDLSDF